MTMKSAISKSIMVAEIIQEFECLVDEVDENLVFISMVDLTDKSRPLEVASMDLSILGFSVSPGTIFYWKIFSDETQKFEKLEKFLTREQLNSINERAKELFNKFK